MVKSIRLVSGEGSGEENVNVEEAIIEPSHALNGNKEDGTGFFTEDCRSRVLTGGFLVQPDLRLNNLEAMDCIYGRSTAT